MNISPVVDDGVNLLQAALKTYILIFLRGVRLADLLPDAATTHTDRTHSPSRPIPHRMSCTDQADNKVLKSAAKGYAMFIETEATPNPATLKFNPGRMVGGDRTHQFSDSSAAAGSPLARRLFAIDQITGSLLRTRFHHSDQDRRSRLADRQAPGARCNYGALRRG
jgi:hypothetical protein